MRIVHEGEDAFSQADKAFLSGAVRRTPSQSPGGRLIDMALPKDSGRKTALARLLVHDLIDDNEVRLRIDDKDTWASSGNPFLFEAVMAHFGGKGIPDNDTFIVFDADEKAALECIVALCLYFCWAFTLSIGRQNLTVSVDDEEFLMIDGNSLPDYWRDALHDLQAG